MLIQGFIACFTMPNIIAAVIGVTIGTLVGVLPGLGISGTIALLIPISFGMDPLTALILFASIFYGAMYGGSTTSILVNVPGEGASVVTCIEGYEMAKKGRAGAALAVAAIGSFIAGSIGLVGLTFFAPMLAEASLSFGPPEYFGISVLGLVILSNLTGTSHLRSGLMVLIGVMLGTVGLDPLSGTQRFTFGLTELLRGIDFIVLVMGVYGLSEIISNMGLPDKKTETQKLRFRELYPKKEEIKQSVGPIFRGGFLGMLVGLIPGPSATISSFASYSLEKKISKRSKMWGKGAIEGVAGPESANNSAITSQMIPLLSLGIPFTPAVALLLSGFMIHGITPGPTLVSSHPTIFWGLIASMFIGNLFLLIINLPFVGVFASLLKIPLSILMPLVAVITFTGAYAINNSLFDLGLLLMFGLLGYFMKKANYELAPMAIGIFLGPFLEKGLKQGLVISNGSMVELASRPITGTFLFIATLLILISIMRWVLGNRNQGKGGGVTINK